MKTMRRIRRRNNTKKKQVVLVFIVATFLVSIFVHQFHPTAVSVDDNEMMVHFHQQQLHKVDGDRIHQNTEMTTNNHSNITQQFEQHDDQHQAATRIRKCLEQRGTNGYWFIDDDFSRKTFYRHGPRSAQWAKSNAGYVPHRTYVGNQYNWKDDDDTIEKLLKCRPMEAVTFSSFCKIMMALNIRRIIFVGDSLTMSQRDSLFKLMKIPKPKGRHIECPTTSSTSSTDPYYIKFRFFRENLGPNYNIQNTSTSVMDEYNNNSTTTRNKKKYDRMQAGPEIAFCNGEPMLNNNNYCSWHIEYNAHPEEKTLLVLNQGAHFHSMETFSNSIDEFVKNFNNNNNNANNNNTMPQKHSSGAGDIIIFRSTVPGHWDCFNKYKPPIDVLNMTHDKFLDRYSTTKYDWNLFDTYYNPYAKRTLEQNLVLSSRKEDITFHYLNVYNMTILRTDEHVSEKDCLHYVSPGPVDFWNHLMLTNLADMVELLQLGK